MCVCLRERDLGLNIMINSIVYLSFTDPAKTGESDLSSSPEMDYDVVLMVKYLCGKFKNSQ